MLFEDNIGLTIRKCWGEGKRIEVAFLSIFLLCVTIFSWLTLAVAVGAAWEGVAFAFSRNAFAGALVYIVWALLIGAASVLCGSVTYYLVTSAKFLFTVLIDNFRRS